MILGTNQQNKPSLPPVQLMPCTITLVRHGIPDFWNRYSFWSVISGSELSGLIGEYDASFIIPGKRAPTEQLHQAIEHSSLYLTSDSPRAIKSAQILGINTFLKDPLFRECGIPHGFMSFLKMPLWSWMILGRTLWQLGYSKNCESKKSFNRRVKKAALRISEYSQDHDQITLVAHGWFNRALSVEMVKNLGWKIKEQRHHYHWGFYQLSNI